jgi:outer membrane protein OmpA-like peptidoglycan-associated protein
MSPSTVDDERERATTPPRLALIITATLLGGMIAAVGVVGANALEPKLTDAANSALRDAQLTDVEVRFDGREAFLMPNGASPAELTQAKHVVEALDGVRWASIVTPADGPTASLSVQTGQDGVVTVAGTVGTPEQAVAVQNAALATFGPGTLTDVKIDEVVPASWVDDAAAVLAPLADVHDVEFTLDQEGATLAGSAADPHAITSAVEAALDGIPLTSTLSENRPTADEEAAINGTVILFIADSVRLNRAARAKVADLAELLLRYPDIDVRITGHVAIPVGTEAEAVKFSARRAQAVYNSLVRFGVAAERLEVVGAGSSEPVGDNSTGNGAASNRRVTVLIMEGS